MNEGLDLEGRIRWGMVGGGQGAFIGAVHRMAARLDDRYLLVAGAPSSNSERARASGAQLRLDPERVYTDYRTMARVEAQRPDGIEVVSIVAPNHLHYDVACAFLDAGIHVVCDKPLTRTLAEADALVTRTRASGQLFGVTYPYSGYPLVRHARDLVRSGQLGEIRVVQAEYAQDWLADAVEETSHKQAAWRTDPAQAGEGGCVADIGTHAFHLLGFVTGMNVDQLSAELTRFVPGRRVDDDAQVRLRFANGARGMLWASQVAPGCQNGLMLRVFGTEGSLTFQQEKPDELWLTPLRGAPQRLTRGGLGLSPAALRATRLPAGHPEGFVEAFGQLYRDMADQVEARRHGRLPDPMSLLLPDVVDGANGMQFVDAALRSSREDGAWVEMDGTRWR
ncbi:MAG TPA: Gfo/Idh/MocA family oxidoreductase [Trinickia sp.]|uniref:Gfo/Idh/MocA family protein n=1 Tax=Trinickia sp. TaxID=2571163 RepID=UPI002CEB7C97|nr:Gfo/Idh/MocA family oxidoreductase [Trinickia sp.]HVW50559.1 Gfo/Idh/MocA family oxidoreductase [Trinickia sp.]